MGVTSRIARAQQQHTPMQLQVCSPKKKPEKNNQKCNNSVRAGSSITAFEVRALYNCIQHISFSLNDRFQSCYNCIGAARQRDDRAVIGFIVRSPQTVSLRGKQVHPTFVDCIEITGNLKIWEGLVRLVRSRENRNIYLFNSNLFLKLTFCYISVIFNINKLWKSEGITFNHVKIISFFWYPDKYIIWLHIFFSVRQLLLF